MLRKDAEVSSYRKLRYSSDLSFLFVHFVPISLSCHFLNAKTNLLNSSVFFVSSSDVDSGFSLRLEDSEAEVDNDEWWVDLHVGIL